MIDYTKFATYKQSLQSKTEKMMQALRVQADMHPSEGREEQHATR